MDIRTLTAAEKAKKREYIAGRRERWKKAGLCTECGNIPDGTYRRCRACRLKNALYQENFRQRKRNELYGITVHNMNAKM